MDEMKKKPKFYIITSKCEIKNFLTVFFLSVALIVLCFFLYKKLHEQYQAALDTEELIRSLIRSA